MPIISDDELLAASGGSALPKIQEKQNEIEDAEGVSFSQGVKAGFVSQNLVTGIAAKRELAPDLPLFGNLSEPLDESYKLTDEKMAGYEEYWDEAWPVDTDEKLEQFKRVVDFYKIAESDVAASGWGGTLGSIAGEISDPTVLIPGTIAVKAITKSGKFLQGAATSGPLIAGAEALQEVAVQQVNPTKTIEESVFEVAVAGVAGATLGGLLGTISGGAADAARAELGDILAGAKGATLRVDENQGLSMHRGVGANAAQMTDVKLKNINERLAKFVSGPFWKELRSPQIRGLTNPLPSVRKVADGLFQHDIQVTRTGSVDEIPAAVETLMRIDDLAFKEVNRSVDAIYKNIPKGTMNWSEFEEAIARNVRTGTPHKVDQVNAASDILQKQYADLGKKLQDVKIFDEDSLKDVLGSVGFFPRRYNGPKILTERNAAIAAGRTDVFTQKITDHFMKKNPEMSLEEASEMATQSVDRITRQDENAIEFQFLIDNMDLKTGKSLTKQRVLDIDDIEIEDYLQNQSMDVFNQYAYQASAMIRYKEWLNNQGAKNLGDIMKTVDDDITKGLKDGSIKPEDAKGIKEEAQEFISNSVNSILGRIVDKKSFNKLLPTVVRTVRKLMTTAQLGGVTITSQMDLMMAPFKQSMGKPLAKAYASSVAQMGKSIKNAQGLETSLRKEANNQYRSYAAGIEIEESQLIKMMLDPGEPLGAQKGRIEKGVELLAHGFGKVSLLSYWNNFGKRMATRVSLDKTYRDLETLASGGKLHRQDLDRLDRLRIGGSHRKRILTQMKRYGESYNGTRLPNLHLWSDVEARQAFQAGTITEVEATIVTPGKGDIPFYMQKSEIAKTIMMYKTFSAAATNKILISGIQRRRDKGMLIATLGLISMGTMVGVMKATLADRAYNTDLGAMLTDGITRSGSLGLYGDYIFGLYNALARTGNYSRYAGLNSYDMLMGPTAPLLRDMLDIMGKSFSDEEFTHQDQEKMLKYVPYNGLFYLKNLIRQGLGVEE